MKIAFDLQSEIDFYAAAWRNLSALLTHKSCGKGEIFQQNQTRIEYDILYLQNNLEVRGKTQRSRSKPESGGLGQTFKQPSPRIVAEPVLAPIERNLLCISKPAHTGAVVFSDAHSC